MIAFGNGKAIDSKRRWTLDTVLVVRDFVEYEMRKVRTALKDWAPDTFLDVTVGPLADYDGNESTSRTCTPMSAKLRLYRGATPDDPVEEMFSFFPAIPGRGKSGFPRPFVDLPRMCFNPASWQAPKGVGEERSFDELSDLWKCLVSQVHDAGLVLGTHAELPGRRVR